VTDYILKRLAATVVVLFFVAATVFAILHLSPGDPAELIAGERATPETIDAIRRGLGLDRPLLEQFVIWLGQLLRGDLGRSIYYNQPVLKLIGDRVEPTLMLTISTMTFAILLAVPLGVLSAWKSGTWIDRVVMTLSVLAFSLPVFLIGYALVLNLSVSWGLLPVQGYVSFTEDLGRFFQHLVLPTISLGLVYAALLARITRATMLEVLNEDYIRTARAKGMSEYRMLIVHALRNSSIPIVTVIGSGIALLIGGVVVTESVFAIAGIGRLTIDAVLHRDYPVIQGVILVIASVYVVINLVVDLSYGLLDPRIRY
jgi:peptide/nickel transport system permease protein